MSERVLRNHFLPMPSSTPSFRQVSSRQTSFRYVSSRQGSLHRAPKSRAQADDERRSRFIRVGVSLFMLFILVFSSVAYFFIPSQTSFRYNGYRIAATVDANGFVQGFTTRIDGTQYSFFSRPEDSLGIPLPAGFVEEISSAQAIFVVFDPNSNLTPFSDAFRFELERSLAPTPIIPAITQPADPTLLQGASFTAFSVISCEQAVPGMPVLILAEGPRGIERTEPCYTISGSQFDFALLRDRIVYRILGVTEE
jgi:hypothetical protein